MSKFIFKSRNLEIMLMAKMRGKSCGELYGHCLRWWTSGMPQPSSARWCRQYSHWGLWVLVLSCKTQGRQQPHVQLAWDWDAPFCAPEACGSVAEAPGRPWGWVGSQPGQTPNQHPCSLQYLGPVLSPASGQKIKGGDPHAGHT